jgi:hypothetical protein
MIDLWRIPIFVDHARRLLQCVCAMACSIPAFTLALVSEGANPLVAMGSAVVDEAQELQWVCCASGLPPSFGMTKIVGATQCMFDVGPSSHIRLRESDGAKRSFEARPSARQSDMIVVVRMQLNVNEAVVVPCWRLCGSFWMVKLARVGCLVSRNFRPDPASVPLVLCPCCTHCVAHTQRTANVMS